MRKREREVLRSGRSQGEDLRKTGRPATTEGGVKLSLPPQSQENPRTRVPIWHSLDEVFESQRDKRLFLRDSDS